MLRLSAKIFSPETGVCKIIELCVFSNCYFISLESGCLLLSFAYILAPLT